MGCSDIDQFIFLDTITFYLFEQNQDLFLSTSLFRSYFLFFIHYEIEYNTENEKDYKHPIYLYNKFNGIDITEKHILENDNYHL